MNLYLNFYKHLKRKTGNFLRLPAKNKDMTQDYTNASKSKQIKSSNTEKYFLKCLSGVSQKSHFFSLLLNIRRVKSEKEIGRFSLLGTSAYLKNS